LASALLCSTAAMAQDSVPAVRITGQIDESQLVTLKGYTHPLAKPANDRGAAAANMALERMHLVLKRSDSQESALRQLIREMHTPGTANYHKWLTPEQFGKQFGPSDQDVAAVETWLSGHGFSVNKVNPGKQTIEFSGSVAQLRSAFHTQIHTYKVNGETHFAAANDPQIPAALAPVVGGFVSLNNFRPKHFVHSLGEALYDPKTGKATPLWTTGTSSALNFVLSPQDYAIQYDLNPLYNASPAINGSGQTIAIVNESNINIARVNEFRSLFGLPANPPQVIIDGNDPGVDGINNPDGPNYASVEAYLDVEWSGAVAPNATIDLVIAADTALENGLNLAAEHAVYGNVAPVISLSFGECEPSLGSSNSFISQLWEQAAAQGITVMVSSGDNGSAGCDNDNSQEYAVNGQAVNGWASTPYNVAVGGTDFYYSDWATGGASTSNYWNTTPSNNTPVVSINAKNAPIPEQAWNDSQYGLNIYNYYENTAQTSMAAGSGGASTVYTTKPAWQTGTGVPADGVRDLPDVSLFAANGSNSSYYPICATDGDCQPVSSGGTIQIYGVGGTSSSAPSFAGIMALVNQKYGRQGQADFVLYPLAMQFPSAFHDVIYGTNTVPCAEGSLDCIDVANPITVQITDYYGNTQNVTEGEIGVGTTPEYNAGTGYDLATGLGTVDAANLVNNWGSVKFATTGTTLTAIPANNASLSDIPHGTPVAVSGTVTGSGTPTGDVSLMTDSTEPAQQGQAFYTLSAGAYSGSISTLPGGTYNIWTQYGGDTNNAPSASQKVPVTISPESSGIFFNLWSPYGAVTSTSAPSGMSTSSIDYGTQLILSAQVAPSSQLSAFETCTTNCPVFTMPTGPVTFSDSGSTLYTANLNAEGDAEYNAPFAIGSHSVAASYAGDSSYNKSTASAIAFTVVQDAPVIFVGASNQYSQTQYIGGSGQATVVNVQVENNAVYSAAYASNFTAMNPVSVAAPTGTITVSGFPSGVPTSSPLSPAVDPSTGAPEGVATFTIPASTSTQNLTITVNYPGDANYKPALNQQFTVQVTQPPSGYLATTTTATVTGSTISPTRTITINGMVTGQSGHVAPTGGVIIYSSGYEVTQVPFTSVSGDVSTFTITLNSQTLFQGANFVTIQYLGDNTYNPSAFTLTSPSPVSNPLSDFSMIPQANTVTVTAGSTQTDSISLTSGNGFSGSVGLTCTAAPGIFCSISPTPVSLSSGGNATATLTINAEADTANQPYNVLITGTDSTGTYIHTVTVQAAVSGSAAGTQSFALSANPTSISVTPGATSGNTSSITVTALGGFTGSVALSCAMTGPPIPSSYTTPSCSMSSAVPVALPGGGVNNLVVTTASTDYPTTYTATVTGTSTPGGLTITLAVPVNLGSFTAASNPTTLTLNAGATTGNTAAITVTPEGSFTGTVTLTCSVASPANANDPATCSLSPGSVALSGSTAQTTTLTISTTATITSMNQIKKLFWPSAGGAALALVLFFGVPRRRRNWLAMLGLLVFFVSVAGIGCGGGGSSGGGGTTIQGTTAGTYTVTVTAVSGSITQTSKVTVTVN
jgi:hypothetical protein